MCPRARCVPRTVERFLCVTSGPERDYRERTSALTGHPLPQDFVDPDQMSLALRLQPIQHFVVDAKGDLRLQRPVVLANGRTSPIAGRQLRSVSVSVQRSIPFPIRSFCRFTNLQLLSGTGRCRCFLHSRLPFEPKRCGLRRPLAQRTQPARAQGSGSFQ